MRLSLHTFCNKSIFSALFPLEGSLLGSGCDMEVCSMIQLVAACSTNLCNLCCSFEVVTLCHTFSHCLQETHLFLCLCFHLKSFLMRSLCSSSWQGSGHHGVFAFQICPTTNTIWISASNWNGVATWRKRALWFSSLPGGTDSPPTVANCCNCYKLLQTRTSKM